jgi:hypothetical protein
MTGNGRALVPYMRQSRAKERTISVEEQRRDIQQRAKSAGVELASEIVEQNVSGSKPWRESSSSSTTSSCPTGTRARTGRTCRSEQNRGGPPSGNERYPPTPGDLVPQNRERGVATERPALCLHRKGQIRNDVRGRTNPLSRRVKLSTVRRRALEGVRPRYTYVLVPAQESYGFIVGSSSLRKGVRLGYP